MQNPDSLLTTEDVANYLKVDVVTVRRLVSRGELAAYRVGAEFRFALTDLQDYLKRQYVPVGRQAPYTKEERFTRSAQEALTQSQAVAEEQHCAGIYASHLLLALAAQPGGIASQALRELGVTAEQVKSVMAAHPELMGPARRAKNAVDLDPGVKRALEAAVAEARKSPRGMIDTQHLLLGLLQDRNGKAAGVLKVLRVRPDALRKKVREYTNS